MEPMAFPFFMLNFCQLFNHCRFPTYFKFCIRILGVIIFFGSMTNWRMNKPDYTVIDPSQSVNASRQDAIDPERQRYPHCIVWTPIPCLTWLAPMIGHMGIATSTGVIRDFAGPYFVSEDNMAFGQPTKFWQVDLEKEGITAEQWDKAVAESCEEYKHQLHILCWNNCHSHTAYALNRMNLRGRQWGAWSTWFYFTLNSHYVNLSRCLCTNLPFIMLFGLIVMLAVLFKLI